MQLLQIAPKLTVNLEKHGLCVESYVSPDIPPQLIKDIADFYRYIFNNNGNYLVFPTSLEFLSPAEVFNKTDGEIEIVDLKTMDSLTEFPLHPQTGEQAIFWHDPETTLAKIRTKLKQDSQVTILKDLETRSIEGLSFGNKTTLSQQFESEGWRNPLYYAGIEKPEHTRDLQNFLNIMSAKMPQYLGQLRESRIYSDDAIYSWNCLTTSPRFRGIENLLALTSQYFASIPESMKKQLPVISEARFQSTCYQLLTMAGYFDVPGILAEKDILKKQEDSLIMIAPLSVIAQNFSLSLREFRKLARNRKNQAKEKLHNYKMRSA